MWTDCTTGSRKGDATLIPEVNSPEDLDGVVAGSGGALGTGGMASKLSAARLAADSGVPVLLAAASDAAQALSGADVGTAFAPRPTRLSARRFWVRHAADTSGDLHLDEGAVRAVVSKRRSLLSAGIVGVSGDFHAGDVVSLMGPGRSPSPGVSLRSTLRRSRRSWGAPPPIYRPTCSVLWFTRTTWWRCSFRVRRGRKVLQRNRLRA